MSVSKGWHTVDAAMSFRRGGTRGTPMEARAYRGEKSSFWKTVEVGKRERGESGG